MNDPKALKERMLRYLLPVCLATLVININKFFEQTWNDPMKTNSKYNKVAYDFHDKLIKKLKDCTFKTKTFLILSLDPCRLAKVMVENEAKLNNSYSKEYFEKARFKVNDCM